MSGIIKVYKQENPFEMIPRATLQDERLSLQAIGLLCNICSYPEGWKLYKTELYTRFPKNKRLSVQNAWKELQEAGYVMERRKRNGKKWDYEYAVRLQPFSEQEQIDFLGCCFSAVENEQSKMDSPKSTRNRIHREDNTHKDNTHKDNTHLSISDQVQYIIEKHNIKKEAHLKDIEELDRLIEDKVYLCFKISDAINNNARSIYAYVKKVYQNDLKDQEPKQPKQSKQPIRTEKLPGWFEEYDQENRESQAWINELDQDAAADKPNHVIAKREALKAKLEKLKEV